MSLDKSLLESLNVDEALLVLRPVEVNQLYWDKVNALAPELAGFPDLLAGLWLLADDLDRSHTISQSIDTPTGSYWHAILHRREGDFGNAKYWFHRVGNHPVIAELGYDPFAFTDDCQLDRGENSPKLVETQRREWKALFDWCLKEAGAE